MPARTRRTVAVATLGAAAALWMALAPASDAVVEPLESAADAAFAPQLVTVDTPTRADKDRLAALGLDLTEHAGHDYVEVVLHTREDLASLLAGGFTFDVRIPDLLARQQERIALDAAYAESTAVSELPSGNTAYRMLEDYAADIDELKELHTRKIIEDEMLWRELTDR
ncbi:MAG: carboxypeptidase, partial [Actinomycetes bacterium]